MKIGNIPKVEKMFFYKRPDGSVFNVGEQDAAKIHIKFKFIGMTEGIEYVKAIKELQAKVSELNQDEIRVKMLEAWDNELVLARENKTLPIIKPLDLGIKGQVHLSGWKEKFT